MLATLYPTELVQPSAQPQDMSQVFIALGPWKSILMGRIFEGEEFYMTDSQVSPSTAILFHKMFNNIPKSFPTQQWLLEFF